MFSKTKAALGRHLGKFTQDDSGAAAVEYALLAALISVFAVAAFATVGTNLSTTFATVAGKL